MDTLAVVKPKIIRQYLTEFSLYDLEGKVSNAIKLLEDTMAAYPEYIDFDLRVDGYEDTRLSFFGYRYENEKERAKRLKTEQKAKDKKKNEKKEAEEYERKLLAKLKKKYET